MEGLPDHDFWPADQLSEYRGYRDRALAVAVPFATYWERHKQS
ncbi:hypothetical protein GCM10010245_08570 [Streptomyces spectabilis]|uniref:Uncharacterized protein n=1 Tax=Streptomyces spectabilis TaxID=68270 RepID=A0A7W8EYG4_STRST|nr:hypothetical protein [Streptomyces spectabilis]GGV03419.1 hypothetical protein GCM10010245_08570 [Streptomyces spectabilis]